MTKSLFDSLASSLHQGGFKGKKIWNFTKNLKIWLFSKSSIFHAVFKLPQMFEVWVFAMSRLRMLKYSNIIAANYFEKLIGNYLVELQIIQTCSHEAFSFHWRLLHQGSSIEHFQKKHKTFSLEYVWKSISLSLSWLLKCISYLVPWRWTRIIWFC